MISSNDKKLGQHQQKKIIIATDYEQIQVDYSYEILEGDIILTPTIVRFSPSFPGYT